MKLEAELFREPQKGLEFMTKKTEKIAKTAAKSAKTLKDAKGELTQKDLGKAAGGLVHRDI